MKRRRMFDALDIIFKILCTSLIGVIVAFGTYFLDYCFWREEGEFKGSIFKGYLPWLAKRLVKFYERAKYDLIIKLDQDKDSRFISIAENYFLYKPLGGCAVCMNVWLALIVWAVLCLLSSFEWYYIFPHVLTSSVVIRKLTGATYQ